MPANAYDAQLDTMIAKYEGAWQPGYAGFPAVIAKLGLKRGVEVGVAFGGHSKAILEQACVEQLTGVDSYRHRADYLDPMNLPQPVFDRLHERTVDRLSCYAGRFAMLREDSAAAAAHFADGSLDFVYLDADHSEAGVLADLGAWALKVRPGGVLAGHDYGHPDFPGVQRAVDRFVSRFGWHVHEAGEGVWWVQATALPISYFTPCYNCEDWVEQSAESILKGNLAEDDEYVLVNDGSSDGTAAALARLIEKHTAVRVIKHDRNHGGSAARNTAVRAARHALCFCLDSDNLLRPNTIAPLRDHLIVSGADVASFQTLCYFKDGQDPAATTHELVFDQGLYDFARVLSTTRVPNCGGNYLFTRQSWERAGGYPEDAGALDAWGFGLRQCATGSTMTVLAGSSYFHRSGHDSYWTRHARTGTMGPDAYALLSPYLDRLDPRDAKRLATARGQRRWFLELDRRPIRLKETATLGPLSKLRGLLGRNAA